MSEVIRAITECIFQHPKESWAQMEGYKVITDKQEILLGIYNSQCCCENWGYFMSEDSFDEFIGAELLSVELVDECLRPQSLPEYMDECSVMFVNFNTSAGLLQFTAYNSHNGYYGHEALVWSKQLEHSETL